MFQSINNTILVAKHEERHLLTRSEVRRLQNTQQYPLSASRNFTPHHLSLAFMKWGIDIVGKLPKAPIGKVLMLAVTYYFSKWIEVEAFFHVRDKEVVSFIKCNILTRFGIPTKIICDNGSQFICKRTREFCTSQGIKMIMSTLVHPQANGHT